MEHILSSKDVWPDEDADGLRDYVRAQWPQLAEALDRECRRIIPEFPTGAYRYDPSATFVSYPMGSGLWHVLGPEDYVREGEVIEVYNHTDKEDTLVEVLTVVAHRMVGKKDRTYKRYVIATFDRVVT